MFELTLGYYNKITEVTTLQIEGVHLTQSWSFQTRQFHPLTTCEDSTLGAEQMEYIMGQEAEKD
jgi:hypothetical protein